VKFTGRSHVFGTAAAYAERREEAGLAALVARRARPPDLVPRCEAPEHSAKSINWPPRGGPVVVPGRLGRDVGRVANFGS
jgi:hypothetical protein